MNRRRKVFDKHLSGFILGETLLGDVKKKQGEPARTLSEEKVTVLEYDDPPADAIARFKKVQFIFYDELLLNVSYVEPTPALSREALHKVLGHPDETPDEEELGEDEEAADIFEVDLEDDPMLSFVAHFDADGNVEALSLCAEMSEDELDDELGEGDEDEDEGEDEEKDRPDGESRDD